MSQFDIEFDDNLLLEVDLQTPHLGEGMEDLEQDEEPLEGWTPAQVRAWIAGLPPELDGVGLKAELEKLLHPTNNKKRKFV